MIYNGKEYSEQDVLLILTHKQIIGHIAVTAQCIVIPLGTLQNIGVNIIFG